MVRTSRPYSCSAVAGVLGRLLACRLAMNRLPVVCPMFFADGEDRTLANRRRGAHDAGFAPQLVTVRWLGMFLEEQLAVPRSRP